MIKTACGRLRRLNRTTSRTIIHNSEFKSNEEEMDEKKSKAQDNQPPVKGGPALEHVPDMTGEGDKILGMTKESSGWDVYNNEARKVDTELVKDWTTSLNFLLIFAAIFAAVLTAFIIESKKMLKQDPTETMVDVMIFYTNNVANGTHTPYKRTDFEPGTPAIVVNSLFFGSLITSLLAALASVVALQWVADYDAAITRGGSSPEDRAKRRQFRYAGVVWWKMSEIIAALPLLLYFSVMLFFAGLILWMWDTNHTVGVVVAGGTAIAVLFYVTSTMIGVAFVSAPFRTPLSRWICTLYRLSISVLYWLMRAVRISAIPDWIKARHSLAITSYRREDRAVENTETLGRDALIWLANQISISQDSYGRLLLLVGELPSLKAEHLPSFDSTGASWYRIFDLLGWRYLRRGSSAITNVEERRHGMEVLQRCYKLPVVQTLVDPVEREALTLRNYNQYWSQYCDSAEEGQWTINHELPNHLFLLLRDIPCPVTFSTQEIEITTKLSQWRNLAVKEPEAWDGLLSVAESLHPDFFTSCVAMLGTFCNLRSWVFRANQNTRQTYLSTVRKVVKIAVLHHNLLPPAIVPLIRAYEALLTQFGTFGNVTPPCIEAPFRYGMDLSLGSADDHATHTLITLLLARQIFLHPVAVRASQVQEVIAMLWLRPSNPVTRNWLDLEIIGQLPDTSSGWIKNADSLPHILEILQHLATAQETDPTVGPLWRTTVPNQVNDPYFVEALQTFDRLMETDCSDDTHCVLINLVCQDLEQEPYPDFDDYFTPSRLDSLTLLKDPCLKILVGCVRSPEFPSVPEAYRRARKESLNRVAVYVHKRFSSIDSPAALRLQAFLWPMNHNRMRFYEDALHDTVSFNFLRRMFKYPVLCYGCLDGPGHLATHLLFGEGAEVFRNLDWLGKISSERRTVGLNLVFLSLLFDGDTSSLVSYLPHAEESIRRTLEEDIKEIIVSQFDLLVMMWSIIGQVIPWPEDIEEVLVGIHKALRLFHDPRSTSILAPLSREILRLRDESSAAGRKSFAKRELVKEKATKVANLLLSNLAVRSIFGRHNSRRIACARALGDVQPAVDWLAPYEA